MLAVCFGSMFEGGRAEAPCADHATVGLLQDLQLEWFAH
jgi:hypothetical protein